MYTSFLMFVGTYKKFTWICICEFDPTVCHFPQSMYTYFLTTFSNQNILEQLETENKHDFLAFNMHSENRYNQAVYYNHQLC